MNPSHSSDLRDDILVEIELAIEGLPHAERAAAIRNHAEKHPEFRGDILAHFELGEWIRPPDRPGDRVENQLRPGEWLGAFQILRFITRGGMGEVYEAREASLDRHVALKVIKKGTVHPTARSRFRREEQVLAKLHHTNIVPIYHAGEQDGTQYCAMQFVRGASLQGVISELSRTGFTSTVGKPSSSIRQIVESILKSTSADGATPTPTPRESVKFDPSTPAPPPRRVPEPAYFESVAALLIPVAEALQHVHEQGVCHRDIKPSNLMIDTAGHCWVIDFGLAGIEPSTGGETPDGYRADEELLTHGLTDGILGTPVYMAPEQFDERPGPASDIWSLGVTLYELLTLRRPFAGKSRKELESAVRAGVPSDPRSIVPNVPRDLQAICLRALEKNPEDRYASAREFADDLRRWLHWQPTAARPAWETLRPLRLWAWRRKAWAATAAVVLFALVGGMIVAAERAQERKKQLVELQNQQDREHAVLESQQIRFGERSFGWFHKAMTLLKAAKAIRPGDDLRDQATATLDGLDSTPIYEHRMPDPPQPGKMGVGQVVFSPDGSRALWAGWRHGNDLSPALLWDGNIANKPTPSSRPGAGPVAFPDENSPLQLVLPLGPGQPLTLWNVGTNLKVVDVPLPDAGEVQKAALSSDARFAAVSFVPTPKANGKLAEPVTRLWAIDWKAAPAVQKPVEWSGGSTALAFSPDGSLIASGTETGEVIVRSTADAAVALRFHEGELPITAVGFGRNSIRPSGERPAPVGPAAGWFLAVGSHGGGLSVWNLRTATRMNRFYGSEYGVYCVAFSPDGTMLASAGRYHPFFWDVGTGRPLLRVHTRGWNAGVAFSNDGRRVAFGCPTTFDYGGLFVYRLDDDRGVRTYRGLTGVVERTWLSPSGRWVAAVAQNWQLGVWDRKTGKLAFIWDVPAGFTADNSAVAFDDNDGSVLFASGERVSRWSLTSGERTDVWKVPFGLNDCLATRPGKKPLLVRRDLLPTEPLGMFRARELGSKGELTELYRIAADLKEVENSTLTAGGRYLLINDNVNRKLQAYLYDGLTGKPIALDAAATSPNYRYGRITESGSMLTLSESAHGVEPRSFLFRLPDLQKIGEHAGGLSQNDDKGKLAVNHLIPNTAVSISRVGEGAPIVNFDVGRRIGTTRNLAGLSADGRFLFWGRSDGTVCVADVNRCLEQLAPFSVKTDK